MIIKFCICLSNILHGFHFCRGLNVARSGISTDGTSSDTPAEILLVITYIGTYIFLKNYSIISACNLKHCCFSRTNCIYDQIFRGGYNTHIIIHRLKTINMCNIL